MEIITLLQSISSQPVTQFFQFIAIMGNEEFYLLALPILLWNWNKDHSKRLFIFFLSGMLLAVLLKDILQIPRPQGVALIEADGFSFPSGHAVSAVLFWGFIALSVKKTWLRIFSLLLIALISFSRIYLGVHWSIDVLGGIALGVLVLISNHLFNKTNTYRAVVLRPLIWALLLFVVTIFISLVIPTDDVATVAGLLLGIGTGFIIEKVYINTYQSDSLWKNITGTIFGCVVVILLWAGLKKLFPDALPFRFARYSIVGFWISLGAPYLFTLARIYSARPKCSTT